MAATVYRSSARAQLDEAYQQLDAHDADGSGTCRTCKARYPCRDNRRAAATLSEMGIDADRPALVRMFLLDGARDGHRR